MQHRPQIIMAGTPVHANSWAIVRKAAHAAQAGRPTLAYGLLAMRRRTR
jgi:hypothetical protein